jgi:transposase-like protein
MKSKNHKQDSEEINLVTLAQEYSSDRKARKFLESLLWPNGPVCPHCQFAEVYKLKPKATSKAPARRGLYKCAACRKQFTVTVGTIMEDSHIPICKWLMAIFIVCSSKKSISANQLHRMLKVTYKSAWFMAHRIRYAMSPEMPLAKMLKGIVEVDETFVGGKGEMRTKFSRKIPVVALVERGGSMHTRVVADVSQKNLGQCLYDFVDKSAILNTDEHTSYRNPGKEYKEHQVVNHSKKEYERRNPDGSVTCTNTAESFFSLLKRGVIGSWHHVNCVKPTPHQIGVKLMKPSTNGFVKDIIPSNLGIIYFANAES